MNKIISPVELPLICGFLQLRHRDGMLFLLLPEETFCLFYLDDICRDIYKRRNQQQAELRGPLTPEPKEEKN